jgi:hypothetical protein
MITQEQASTAHNKIIELIGNTNIGHWFTAEVNEIYEYTRIMTRYQKSNRPIPKGLFEANDERKEILRSFCISLKNSEESKLATAFTTLYTFMKEQGQADELQSHKTLSA